MLRGGVGFVFFGLLELLLRPLGERRDLLGQVLLEDVELVGLLGPGLVDFFEVDVGLVGLVEVAGFDGFGILTRKYGSLLECGGGGVGEGDDDGRTAGGYAGTGGVIRVGKAPDGDE